ncbi:shikimate dehydrogenase [Kriegella aquimaris]|uniref:Shikimate dehydrogenase (NADP(+)) n=1 Tax=Kriegella aquimaris TaxID=192904 RepID=A0A1G9LZ03_9FLAO|nr:shikimate dehydrogenase [Kriegella aquimaris]SDL67198.1 shikimate dehydrogenase [Kriegella aquimaris]
MNTDSNTPIDFLPQLTGCFAQPAAENPTVAMVEAAYQHHGLHFRYVTCEVSPENLNAAVNGAKAMGWSGFNCSLPHKVAIIKYLDELGESAKLIGAVNTIVKRGNRWIGENTDGKGFLQALKEIIDPDAKHITLFGAGGAARAIAVELALAGAESITIVNRSKQRADEVVRLLNENTSAKAFYKPWDEKYAVAPSTDIIINATSIGLFPNIDEQLNIDFNSIKPNMVVADCIPNPPQTHLLKTAANKGCKTIDGLGMLVNQGVIGIKFWTDTDVDAAVMHSALKKVLHIKE